MFCFSSKTSSCVLKQADSLLPAGEVKKKKRENLRDVRERVLIVNWFVDRSRTRVLAGPSFSLKVRPVCIPREIISREKQTLSSLISNEPQLQQILDVLLCLIQ